jgi:hypothetical protein
VVAWNDKGRGGAVLNKATRRPELVPESALRQVPTHNNQIHSRCIDVVNERVHDTRMRDPAEVDIRNVGYARHRRHGSGRVIRHIAQQGARAAGRWGCDEARRWLKATL